MTVIVELPAQQHIRVMFDKGYIVLKRSLDLISFILGVLEFTDVNIAVLY